MEPGTEFSFLKISPHLIPEGWTNDPHELELCLAYKLHEYYTSFPTSCIPILAYTGDRGWWGHLLKAGSQIYVLNLFHQLFRLNKSVELTRLLECMREQTDSVTNWEEQTPNEHRFFWHPDLDWDKLGQDEWTEKKKAYEASVIKVDEDFRQHAKERAIMKCTRENYVNWVGMVTESSAEKRWEKVKETLQQNDYLVQITGREVRAALDTARKEYLASWKAIAMAKAGEEYDTLFAKAEAEARYVV